MQIFIPKTGEEEVAAGALGTAAARTTAAVAAVAVTVAIAHFPRNGEFWRRERKRKCC